MINFCFLIALISSAFAGTPRAFETDYCTYYAEGTIKEPHLWRHCCLEHDLFMWAGGLTSERDQADLDLKSCVAAAGNETQARLIYAGVRAGSHSPFKDPKKKWNNAWPKRPDSQALTANDIDKLQEIIWNGYDYVPVEMKDHFLKTLRNR